MRITKFTQVEEELTAARGKSSRRKIGKTDYYVRGILYLPEAARFTTLLQLSERENISKTPNEAIKTIEDENEDLKGVLPRTYTHLENKTLVELLKLRASILLNIEGDAFGKIYEYFLGNFAMSEV